MSLRYDASGHVRRVGYSDLPEPDPEPVKIAIGKKPRPRGATSSGSRLPRMILSLVGFFFAFTLLVLENISSYPAKWLLPSALNSIVRTGKSRE
eukprot:1180425-Prorocentrum_minimum.AAC.3